MATLDTATESHDAGIPDGMCDKCFEGFKLDGTPAGSESKIGPFVTYVAQPACNASESTAVIIFSDIFGIKAPNTRLLADKIAEKTGFTVYAPDLFHGDPIDAGLLKIMPQTAEDARSPELVANLSGLGAMPWSLRHKPAERILEAVELVKVLKTEKGVTKLGAVGYCYGGPFVAHFDKSGDIQAGVHCHPSHLTVADVHALKGPTSFALAEEDFMFDAKLVAQAREILKTKDFDSEIVVYQGTAHGFASRPNLAIEDVRKGFEGALAQTSRFLKKHLS